MPEDHPRDTKQRILDAAEQEFARQGFAATSLRIITRAAGVNLAAVNYHFGSKEGLLDAVIARRIEPLNATRQARLAAVLAGASGQGTPAAREVWRAMVEPTLRLREPGSGAEHFISVIGRILAEPTGPGREIFMRYMGPVLAEFYEAMHGALPDLSRSLLYWRLHFAVGSLSHLMRCNEQGLRLPEGVTPTTDVEALIDMLLDYTIAGLEVKPC